MTENEIKLMLNEVRKFNSVAYKVLAIEISKTVWRNHNSIDKSNVQAISSTGNYMQFPLDKWVKFEQVDYKI